MIVWPRKSRCCYESVPVAVFDLRPEPVERAVKAISDALYPMH